MPLLQVATKIFVWAEAHLEALTAAYIPGSQNSIVDHLSREFPDKNEWALNQKFLEPIFSEWGTPSVDLMATRVNTKTPQFVSRFRCNKALTQDAFSILWDFPLVYIFPPVPLVIRTLLKIAREKVHTIIILPFWPQRPWFPLLLHMASAPPRRLPLKRDLLWQCQCVHPNPNRLQTDSLAAESTRLQAQGISKEVISTLLKSRKASTNVTYNRIWAKFTTFALQKNFASVDPNVAQVLDFLQSALNKGLAYSTLKVQISALSCFTGYRWADEPLVKQFLKATMKINPPRKSLFPAWVLGTVLRALLLHPFVPAESCPFWFLTLKLFFLSPP